MQKPGGHGQLAPTPVLSPNLRFPRLCASYLPRPPARPPGRLPQPVISPKTNAYNNLVGSIFAAKAAAKPETFAGKLPCGWLLTVLEKNIYKENKSYFMQESIDL